MTKLTNRKKNTLSKVLRKARRGAQRRMREVVRLENEAWKSKIPREYLDKYGII